MELKPLPDGTRPDCVVYDFDGTICDSAPGVFAALRATFEEIGLEQPEAGELRRWIGPPTDVSFRARAGLDPHAAEAARRTFRRHYDEIGMQRSEPYAGMVELVEELDDAGIPQAIATSKPEFAARALLERFGIAERFTTIAGASADEKNSDKAWVLGRALEGLREAGRGADAPVLIGDRIHDVAGGRAHGVPTIAAVWGYGAEEEWVDAIARAADPAALRGLLIGG